MSGLRFLVMTLDTKVNPFGCNENETVFVDKPFRGSLLLTFHYYCFLCDSVFSASFKFLFIPASTVPIVGEHS